MSKTIQKTFKKTMIALFQVLEYYTEITIAW